MEEVAEGFARRGEATLEVVDVDSRAELVERYGDEVPVLLIDGRKAFKYRVEERELGRRLKAHRRRQRARVWRARLGM